MFSYYSLNNTAVQPVPGGGMFPSRTGYATYPYGQVRTSSGMSGVVGVFITPTENRRYLANCSDYSIYFADYRGIIEPKRSLVFFGEELEQSIDERRLIRVDDASSAGNFNEFSLIDFP